MGEKETDNAELVLPWRIVTKLKFKSKIVFEDLNTANISLYFIILKTFFLSHTFSRKIQFTPYAYIPNAEEESVTVGAVASENFTGMLSFFPTELVWL